MLFLNFVSNDCKSDIGSNMDSKICFYFIYLCSLLSLYILNI